MERPNATLWIVLGLLLVAPAATAANLERVGGLGPCLTTDTEPPFVGADPKCRISAGSSSSESMNASATLAGTDVLVAWDRPANDAAVGGYEVLRGSNPYDLAPVGVVDANQHAYTDSDPATDGEFLWYRVQAVDEESRIVAESPVLHVQSA